MNRLLRWLLLVMGVASIAIGAAHLVAGAASVPGESFADATVDSRERFYGAIFLGYGVARVYAARRSRPTAVHPRGRQPVVINGKPTPRESPVFHSRQPASVGLLASAGLAALSAGADSPSGPLSEAR
ncbi:DUF4345 domain-containing protein [Streptomyces sp. UNOB3_S3]|uniref:DUF4345 domain-containing protein n=1 Tax=Streptomyces sp. UNOB3_S3 TaxID=2871682 RepID=UPI001E40D5A9|nr:DUF4345 domain-containing protein [Streptomyces sp. UNOB3_S3]MCC3774255.1 DUF4345 domain-containing protein [Streptomyces sp. UNOB3_S3]